MGMLPACCLLMAAVGNLEMTQRTPRAACTTEAVALGAALGACVYVRRAHAACPTSLFPSLGVSWCR